jgi:hypothetical protein
MHHYLLLLHERPADSAELSPADIEEIIADYRRWSEDLAARGLLVSGEKLADDGGRHLRLHGDKPLATDGPYAEAHDVIGGLFIVKADDDDAAQQLAATCPHLRGSQWIEIRRIEPV